ncbi:unnamed protein product [Leptidea sinapis]|uniref:GDNF/GAS1 domain-containing protein n=1 Tax=Leptidea sinapis TaxID=189913 RepID=A0A5E4QI34_9NEOP|nr:unnamed protein product [Leptidea sinapis]
MWWSALVLLLVVGRSAASSCEEARLRCAYRSGCGTALNNYMMLCNECKCEDAYCVDAKQKINVCRAQVLKGAANVSSSCRLSQLICQADAQCRTALDYYNEYCRSVYRGRKCSKKCLNSIQILRKQEKAAALTACQCDGNEDYDCPKMQSNLDRLCFHKHHKNHTKNHEKSFEQRHKKTQHSHSAAERNLVSVLLIITLCISLTSNS